MMTTKMLMIMMTAMPDSRSYVETYGIVVLVALVVLFLFGCVAGGGGPRCPKSQISNLVPPNFATILLPPFFRIAISSPKPRKSSYVRRSVTAKKLSPPPTAAGDSVVLFKVRG
jgi:hypothetical protein